MKKPAIIFDMDGVIADTEPYHCQAWINACQVFDIPIDQKYYFAKICGNASLVSAQMILNEFDKNERPEELVKIKSEAACQLLNGVIQAFPGVVARVQDFSLTNFTLGLVSSSSYKVIDTVLRTLGIKDYFQIIHGAEAFSLGKPDPEPYARTAYLLGQEPWDCVVIEDSKSGVIAAKRAGAKCIAYLNGHNRKADLGLADKIVNSFEKIDPRLICSL